MNPGNLARTLGILLTLFSLTQLPSLLLSWYYQDGAAQGFTYGFFISFSSGLILWQSFNKFKGALTIRDGILLTCLFWSVLSLFGAIPIALSDSKLSFTDAAFESFSGFTTTGATVIENIDLLPRSIVFFRHQLQWMGGMGIVVLAVAILPMLGVGGVNLYRAEATGPQDSRLTTSITQTAKILWYIYLVLTVVCALAYYLAGMTMFDAIAHSFTTIAIGGFSTHDSSFAAFNSPLIESVAVFFMFVSGVNFSLHFFVWKKHTLRHYWQDPEFRMYVFVLSSVIVVCFVALYLTGTAQAGQAFRESLFQAVSMATTTGYSTAHFSQWPLALPVLLILTSFIGGCIGSTAGGMKVLRVLLLIKQGYRELKRMLHPNAVFNIRLSGRPVYDKTIDAVWGFVAVYIIFFVLIMLVLMMSGLETQTAWSVTAASLNNLGPALGDAAYNYSGLNDFAKWVLCFAMLLGRLEIFTLLIIFTPLMWRR